MSYKKLRKEFDKLNNDFEILNNKVSEEVAVTSDQISFAIVEDNNITDEILKLDILSMTPLDAMNALFNLQKKVKK